MMHLILAAGGLETEKRLLIVLVQLAVIIGAARLFANLFRKLGQPAAVGEIAAGLILGPSVLGKLEKAGYLPQVSGHIFDPSVAPVFGVMSQIGLIFLLFLIGLEFDFAHVRSKGRAALSISIAGIAVPFGSGALLGHFMHPHLEKQVGELGFILFMGTAMSITALPILGRMMMELNIQRSRIGAITITSAAVDDATGWILLAAVSALVTAHFQILDSVRMIALTVGFAAAMIWLVRPLMRRWLDYAMRSSDELSPNVMTVVFIVLFLCSIATNLIGIFAIFGAFLLGAILSDHHRFREAAGRSLHGFITVFFLPIFFTYTGLRTDIGTLTSAQMWLFAGAVSAVAILGKFGGCTLAAWLSGFPSREAACIGLMMNTRALMELVVINVGADLGVITPSVFCMLVMMALLTTVMTTPLLILSMRGTELEPLINTSGFRAPFVSFPRPGGFPPAEVESSQRA